VSEYVSLEVGVGLPSIGIAKIFFSKIQEQKMCLIRINSNMLILETAIYLMEVVDYLCSNRTYYGLKGFNFE
jgi:hypothetical protein